MSSKKYLFRGILVGLIVFATLYVLSLFYLGCSGDITYLCPGDFIQTYLDTNFPIRKSYLLQEPIIYLVGFVSLGAVAGWFYGRSK
jgi:hypothetical protein